MGKLISSMRNWLVNGSIERFSNKTEILICLSWKRYRQSQMSHLLVADLDIPREHCHIPPDIVTFPPLLDNSPHFYIV